ncbi:type II secretion system protein GspM [Mixta tenebrionis]|uniref:Type II secretion system protein M n=1 Tax=Mixta tenebrionis TaxID=2562439 RepID=A0A506V6E0_9GAMM|nr:type II secretion system protein GspM [Mixta tenebrionis]TPW41228.1 type II secretion system protein M [Mixta tenebrionis]
MKRIKTRWRQQTQRERLLLIALALVLLTAFLWLGVWRPLEESIAHEQQRQRRLTQQLRQLPTRAVKVQDLPLLLRQSASASSISLTQVEVQNGKITLRLAPVDGDKLLQWIAELETRQALRITEIGLHAAAVNGQVDVDTLQLERR